VRDETTTFQVANCGHPGPGAGGDELFKFQQGQSLLTDRGSDPGRINHHTRRINHHNRGVNHDHFVDDHDDSSTGGRTVDERPWGGSASGRPGSVHDHDHRRLGDGRRITRD
jgi:hypothetical protein